VRIDAHQHFWRYTEAEYGWIDSSMPVLRRDFLPDDLRPELETHGFDGCVAVQARASLEENEFLLGLAHESPFVRGVVGWVDLCAADASERLAELARDRRFVGVRHLLQDEADDAYMLRPEFRRGVAELARHDLVYDLLIRPRHLEAARALVRELPEQRFVLDHLAKPEIAAARLEPWRSELGALAELPNVCCKLSGLVTEASWSDWTPEQLTPFVEAVLDAFRPERLLFGSDWPVCQLAASYAEVVGLVHDHATRLSRDEQAALYGGTAARVYRLAESD
jgi:L-fuconolactonase